jgi:hypothetical protein
MSTPILVEVATAAVYKQSSWMALGLKSGIGYNNYRYMVVLVLKSALQGML